MKIAVIAVGYNRLKSLSRLLDSITAAEYRHDEVDLVVSLDKGACLADLVAYAETINWPHGQKHIRAFSERQGLRPHILQCGDLTQTYDAVIVLEDDIVVAQDFYLYCRQMLECYADDERIAGISLYSFRYNPGNHRAFEPAESQHDVYLMQVAQSWGQCWTRRMWKGFRTWYEASSQKGDVTADEHFPRYIANWNAASWLKYYDKYVVETNRYFVYPYKSLSTNFSDVGEHAATATNVFQVPLMQGLMVYRCAPLEEAIRYDIFFERLGMSDEVLPELRGKKLLDLSGIKHCFADADYLISVQRLPYKVVKELKLQYRPIEDNLRYPQEGKGIYVYDLKVPSSRPVSNEQMLTAYSVRTLNWKSLLHFGLLSFWYALRRKLMRK